MCIRDSIDTYRITARGGKGIRNYDAAKDKVAAVKIVDDVDDVLLSSCLLYTSCCSWPRAKRSPT